MEKDPTQLQTPVPSTTVPGSITAAGGAPAISPEVASTIAPALVAPVPVPAKEVPALVPKKQVAPVAKTPTAPSASKMEEFLKASKRTLNRSSFSAEKLATIDNNIKNGFTLSDAEKNVDARHALHVILTGGPDKDKLVPGATSVVDINTDLMRKNIASVDSNLSSDEQIKYGRAMQIFDSMTANNFKVMKGPAGTYWLESLENGKKVFASNGILEVAELLDRFSGPLNPEGKTEETKVETNPKKLAEIVAKHPNAELLSEAEDWMLASLATNALTTAIGIGGKLVTVATGGTGFLAGGAGTAIGAVGGIAALGMSFYSDFINSEVSNSEMWTNLGIGAGLELAETVSIAPVSVLNGLKGASTAGKVLRKSIHLYMMKGVLDTAVGTEWLELFDKKGSYSVDEWRQIATMSQFILGAAGGAALNRVGSRKIMTKQVQKANTTLGEVDKKMRPFLPKTNTEAVNARKAAANSLVAKKTTAIKSEVDSKVTDLSTNYTAKKAEIKLEKKGVVAAARASAKTPEPVVDSNGQTALPFDAPEPKPVNLSSINSKYKKKNLELDSKYADDKTKAQQSASEAISKVELRGKAIKDWAGKRQEKIQGKTNDEVISTQYKKDKDDAVQGLADSQTKLEAQHGSVIAKKLRAKAERLSKVPADQLAESNAKQGVVKKDSKLEAFAKEKKALDEKLKDVEVAKRTPEDVAELKRIEDGIVLETKKTKGIRGKANKLVARVKAGSTSTGKAMGSLAKYTYALPTSLAVRDGVSSKALAKAAISGDAVYNLTGNRFYKYNKEDAKTRLMQEGYSEEEIDKYNLEQQRNALYMIEKGLLDDKGKKEEKKEERALVIKRPKILKKSSGGSLYMLSRGEPIQKFQGGRAFISVSGIDEVVKKNKEKAKAKAELDERNRLTIEYNRKMAIINAATTARNVAWRKSKLDKIAADLAAQLEKNKANNFDIKDVTPVGALTNVGEAEAAAIAKAKAETEEVEKQYKQLSAGIVAPERKKFGFGVSDVATVFGEFKPSDFLGKAKMFVERPPREDVKAATFMTSPVENMPGFERAMDRTAADSQRVDTADMFLHRGVMQEKFAEAGKQRAELIARNAQYVGNAKAERINNINRNTEAAINAENANIQAKNSAESVYSAQRAQGLAAVKTANDKQAAQRLNGIVSGLSKLYKNKRTESITSKYNDVAAYKSIWNTEYKPRYDIAVAEGDQTKIKQVKVDFMLNNKVDPDLLDKQLMEYKTEFKAIDA